MHVHLLDVVSGGLIDQALKLIDSLFGRGRYVHVLHLETQVALTDQALTILVDMLNHGRVNLDTKLLGFGKFVVEHFDALPDCLVVVAVHNAVDEVSHIKFFFEPEMKHFSLVE